MPSQTMAATNLLEEKLSEEVLKNERIKKEKNEEKTEKRANIENKENIEVNEKKEKKENKVNPKEEKTSLSPAPKVPTTAISIGNIRGFGRSQAGLFKMSSDVFGWKNKFTNRVYQYKGSEVVKVNWVELGNYNQLRFFMNANCKESPEQIIRFDGFKDESYDNIARHLKTCCNLDLKKQSTAKKGWHWGTYELDGKNFSFNIHNSSAFDVHTPELTQVSAPTKTDLSIEFQQDDTKEPGADELMEIRFYVPPGADPNEETQPLDKLKKELIMISGLGEGGQGIESIVSDQIFDVHLLVPRGRYELDLGPTALKFHGKSYDYTMPYQNILRMFLVPRPNSPHLAFVIALENAMRQGQTRYPFVVMQFDEKTETEVTLNLTEAQLIEYELEKHLSGKLYDILPRLLKALSGKPIIVPGDFRSTHEQAAVRCSCRAQDGHLYPLSRSFLYIIKPLIFIKYDDVVSVEFSRTSATDTTRYFEFRVSCKGGTEYDFTSIDRNEYKPLVEFLQTKNIRIRNLQEIKTGSGRETFPTADLPSEEESDDEEFNADDTDASDESYGSESEDEDADSDGGEAAEKSDESTHKSDIKEKNHKKHKKDKKHKKNKKHSKGDASDKESDSPREKKKNKKDKNKNKEDDSD